VSLRDEALEPALVAHKAGRVAEAEAGYRRVLSRNPSHPLALYSLALILFHRGEIPEAIDCAGRAAEQTRSSGRFWNTLGSMLMAARRETEARDAYRRCTEVEPGMAEGWYNLGICLRNEHDYEAAIGALRQAISRTPPFGTAYEALAMLLYELGRMDEAARVGALWAAHDPANAKARHVMASMSGDEVPKRASDDYVREHFDAAASGFDKNLGQLEYRAPELVARSLERLVGARLLPTVADVGCGTGLCGPLVRSIAKHLVGVDLSPKMIERARERGTYDELQVGELCTFLRGHPNAFDAIISADTLVYFGALEDPCRAARAASKRCGLFVFTLEALPEADDADYRLQFHGRYAHGERYVLRTLAAAGLEIESIRREVLRKERLDPVNGFVVAARCPAA
jgi:predicted TPR repeat methyltransferase